MRTILVYLLKYTAFIGVPYIIRKEKKIEKVRILRSTLNFKQVKVFSHVIIDNNLVCNIHSVWYSCVELHAIHAIFIISTTFIVEPLSILSLDYLFHHAIVIYCNMVANVVLLTMLRILKLHYFKVGWSQSKSSCFID